MHTRYGELTYCTNIHAGESWPDHFAAVKRHVPGIKKELSPNKSFGIGLRLSNIASEILSIPQNLFEFNNWLKQEDCYVFTMNGFPFGGFHNTIVKDLVHAPDWQTEQRVEYTIRLFDILEKLLPENEEGSISTSPLSYKYWHLPQEYPQVMENTTRNILRVVEHLVKLNRLTGKVLHLDIEPEPDGLLESGPEFINWFEDHLLPSGIEYLAHALKLSEVDAANAIRLHVRLCYDVCHFAVGYENHKEVISLLERKNILVGKIQISAALRSPMPTSTDERSKVISAFRDFNEATYLHQVVAAQGDTIKRYPDLPEALLDADNPKTREWRSHFHVPLFVERYDVLWSTQQDIREVLTIHRNKPFTKHLEVETYKWEVLPS